MGVRWGVVGVEGVWGDVVVVGGGGGETLAIHILRVEQDHLRVDDQLVNPLAASIPGLLRRLDATDGRLEHPNWLIASFICSSCSVEREVSSIARVLAVSPVNQRGRKTPAHC